MLYDIAKFLHITGVAMLMGNITVTGIWTFFADRDGRPQVLARTARGSFASGPCFRG